jgi:hypothetical protein
MRAKSNYMPVIMRENLLSTIIHHLNEQLNIHFAFSLHIFSNNVSYEFLEMERGYGIFREI